MHIFDIKIADWLAASKTTHLPLESLLQKIFAALSRYVMCY